MVSTCSGPCPVCSPGTCPLYSCSMRTLAFLSMTLATAACTPSRDVPPTGTNPVKWSASASAVRPAPDGSQSIDIELRADIDDTWHVYSLGQKSGGPVPMTVKVAPAPLYELSGSVTGPIPERKMDPNFGIETETYSGSPVFRLTVKEPAATQAAASATPIELKVRSQACSDKLCLPARTTTLSIDHPRAGT